MAVLVYLVLFLALLTGHSSALYCICKDGVSDTQLQKTLDYACGAGADCTPILQNGACFQPNTVKDHCSYAVNSYYQKKAQVAGSCEFSQTATTSTNPPASVPSTCVYPSSPSNAGTTGTTPSTTPTPTTGTGTGTGTGTTTTPTGITPTPFVGTGLGPSGTGIDSSGVASVEGITSLIFACLASGLFLLLW